MYPVPQNQKLFYHVYMCEHLAKMYLFGSEKYTNVSGRSDALSTAMQYKFVTDTK